jgi:hypothetical protein
MSASERPADTSEFSVIKFFQLLEKRIAGVNKYPIQKKNLNIQQDAYKRLAQGDDDEIFAYLECGRKEADTDVRFSVEFTAACFIMTIEGQGAFVLGYSNFTDEEDAARQIVEAMIMLSNGQLAVLITTRHSIDCAKELLVYPKGTRVPLVLGTDAKYPWWWKQTDESGYDCVILRNRLITEKIELPKKHFLLDRTPKGELLVKGRSFRTPELTPLTKQLYDHFIVEYNKRLAGKKEGESDWSLFYRSWEFWLLIALLGGLYAALAATRHLPQLLQYPVIVAPVGMFLIYFILLPVLQHKQQLRELHPDHPWVRFDARMPEVAHKSITALAPAMLFAATFWPVYMLRHSDNITSWYQLPLLSAIRYAVPACFVAATLLAFITKRWAAFVYALVLGAGCVGGILVNFIATNSDASTPEPYSTITAGSYLVALGTIWMKVRLAKRIGKAERQPLSLEAKIRQLTARVRRAAAAQLIAGYSGAAALAGSAVAFAVSLPDSSVKGGHASIIWGLMVTAASLIGGTALLVHAKKFDAKRFGWVCTSMLIGVLLSVINLIKNNTNEGSALAWICMFTGLGLPLGASAIHEVLSAKLLAAKLDERLFQRPKR